MSNYWNQLSKESQKEIIDWYKKSKAETPSNEFDKGKIYAAELLFGKENLKPKFNSKIKTWKDCLKQFDDEEFVDSTLEYIEEALEYDFSDSIIKKVIATLKISKIIELSDRKVTKDEFMNNTDGYYSIRVNNNDIEVYSTYEYNDLIFFRTDEEAREFKNNNINLLKDYFQIN